MDVSYFPFNNRADAQIFSQRFTAAWDALLRVYKLCTSYPGGAKQPTPILPQILAGQFWQAHGQNLLPHPRPYIAPGFALTGKLAYLETNSPLVDSFSDSTPIGVLTIQVKGQYLVNWGDGSSPQGPITIAGTPYPTPNITHVWDQMGSYDVTVTENWTATWTLAGQSGSLGGLSTSGTIPGLAVEQVESIINR
ncbi:MAG: hypothetical protein ACRD0I_12180 [Acidimicrobiales bacterium]